VRIREKARVEKPVVEHARRLGIFVTKLELPHYKGMPDDVFWLRGGRPVLIEFKAPGCEPGPLQALHHRLLTKLGYRVFVIDDAIEGKDLIDKLFKEAHDEEDRGINTGVCSRQQAVDAARLPEAHDEVHAGKGMRRPAARPWHG
jgi:hypothetical protein